MNTDERGGLPPSAENPEQPTALVAVTPTQLVNRPASMPAVSVDEARERYAMLVSFVRELMQEGVDYGAIPGTGNKRTLFKPGAEKLTTFFGLSTRFEIIERVEDWTGDEHNGEPFFYYLYRCRLMRGDVLIAEADGSCNSWEKKYRWRKGEIACPECGQPAIIKGREEYGGGWVCFKKKGGCGAKYPDTQFDQSAVAQTPNREIFDQVNTLQKMGEKRALVAATLLAVNASEFFTQDLEDMTPEDYSAARTSEPTYYPPPDRAEDDRAAAARVVPRRMEDRQRDALRLVDAEAVSREGDRYLVRDGETVHEVTKGEGGKARCTCDEYHRCVAADGRFRCPHMLAAKLWTPPKGDGERWACSPATRRRLEAAIKDESESGLKGAYTSGAIVKAILQTWPVEGLHELTEEQAVAAAERVESHVRRLREAPASGEGAAPADAPRKSRAGGGRR